MLRTPGEDTSSVGRPETLRSLARAPHTARRLPRTEQGAGQWKSSTSHHVGMLAETLQYEHQGSAKAPRNVHGHADLPRPVLADGACPRYATAYGARRRSNGPRTARSASAGDCGFARTKRCDREPSRTGAGAAWSSDGDRRPVRGMQSPCPNPGRPHRDRQPLPGSRTHVPSLRGARGPAFAHDPLGGSPRHTNARSTGTQHARIEGNSTKPPHGSRSRRRTRQSRSHAERSGARCAAARAGSCPQPSSAHWAG